VAAYRALRGLFMPAEIKAVTREEFEHRAEWQSSVERAARVEGRRLYDSAASPLQRWRSSISMRE
jgi:hypothetical protein